MKPKNFVKFSLVDYQRKKLHKFHKILHKAYEELEPGMVILQPWGKNNKFEYLKGGFIPNKEAIQINEIIRKVLREKEK